MDYRLSLLSSRAGFNTALRHFKSVNGIAAQISRGENFSDVVNNMLSQGALVRPQIQSILNTLLVDKFAYAYSTHNIHQTVEDGSAISGILSEWTNLQIVFAYHNPQTGLAVINPSDAAQLREALPLVKDELLVIYVGTNSASGSVSVRLQDALISIETVLYGGKVEPERSYVSAKVDRLKPGKGNRETDTARNKHQRVTPRYSVLVTNELFHNGNVEAWKKIIDSYKGKHPDLDVLIWYENERINDLNTLFKWGKVKHGTPIVFSVAGDMIKGVAKLQRYLFEGASPRFEVFLQGVGRVLDLF